MQGTLSASLDQINWVLTSYIVAAAIMTAPVGWIANRFGRKRHVHRLLGRLHRSPPCCAGWRRTSTQMVLFRLLQGVFGAALVPLSQAVMLDSYALQERGQGDGDLGHRRDARPDHGPDARRLADRHLLLALGVLRQSAVRHLHRARPAAVHGRDQTADRELRFDWFGFPRSPSASARCSLCSTAASSSAGSNPTRSSPSSSSRSSASTIFLAHSLTRPRAVHPVRAVQGPQFRRRLRVHGRHGAGAVLAPWRCRRRSCRT